MNYTENPVETFECNGHTVKVFLDTNPLDPRKFRDCFSTILGFNRRWSLGEDSSFEAFLEMLEQEENDEIGAFAPIIVRQDGSIEHLGWENDQPLRERRCDGVIYALKSKFEEEFGSYDYSKGTDLMEAELRDDSFYGSGTVYGYEVVVDGKKESCWGFYGPDNEKNGLMEAVRTLTHTKD